MNLKALGKYFKCVFCQRKNLVFTKDSSGMESLDITTDKPSTWKCKRCWITVLKEEKYTEELCDKENCPSLDCQCKKELHEASIQFYPKSVLSSQEPDV